MSKSSAESDSVIFMQETYRLDVTTSNPSSTGSYTSTISTELSVLSWCSGIFLLSISVIVTALLIARPIAFKTIVVAPSDCCALRVCQEDRKGGKRGGGRRRRCSRTSQVSVVVAIRTGQPAANEDHSFAGAGGCFKLADPATAPGAAGFHDRVANIHLRTSSAASD